LNALVEGLTNSEQIHSNNQNNYKMTNKERALKVADEAHKGQKYGVHPYSYHLLQVANIAEKFGYEETIVVASILHDVLEDTSLSFNYLRKFFGEEVAEIVYCVTDELGRNREERKAKTYPKIAQNWKATAVKICDRIANIQESKKYSPRLFEMYKKEHNAFCKNLMCNCSPRKELDKAWNKLNSLMKTQ
jgi:(p)ppGpp synthase/HD superfamily hydrolase